VAVGIIGTVPRKVRFGDQCMLANLLIVVEVIDDATVS
jgi:hypothetical protein